jgi:hypothetical protein
MGRALPACEHDEARRPARLRSKPTGARPLSSGREPLHRSADSFSRQLARSDAGITLASAARTWPRSQSNTSTIPSSCGECSAPEGCAYTLCSVRVWMAPCSCGSSTAGRWGFETSATGPARCTGVNDCSSRTGRSGGVWRRSRRLACGPVAAAGWSWRDRRYLAPSGAWPPRPPRPPRPRPPPPPPNDG